MRVYIYIISFLFIVGLIFLVRFFIVKESRFRKNMTEGMSDYNKLQFLTNRKKKTTITVLLVAIPLVFLGVIGFGMLVNIGIK